MIAVEMENARMENASALATTRVQIAASVFAIFLVCTELATAVHANVRLDGQEHSATLRCVLLVARSTEHVNLMQAASAQMDGREMIAQPRSALDVQMEFVQMEFVCVLMDMEELPAQLTSVALMDAMEMENVLVGAANATRDFMDAIALWSSALIAKALIVIVSTDHVHVRVGGQGKTARSLSAIMIALAMVFAMMGHVSATLAGLDPIARQRSVLESRVARLATTTDVATPSAFNVSAPMDGQRLIVQRSRVPTIALETGCAMTGCVPVLPASPELIARKVHA